MREKLGVHFFKKKLTWLWMRACSLDSNNFQFYFHEVLKPINEPSKKFSKPEEKLQENL